MQGNTNLLLLIVQAVVLASAASPSTACDAAFTIFNATQAYNCLRSVPFHPEVASRLLKYLNDTIQFHSPLAYLANPPPTYQQPAVDLVAGISRIQSSIDNGVFQNEYAFEAALKQLLNAAHDDHLGMSGGILSAFAFGSPYDLVSVSLDGIELPKVYIAGELLANETTGLPWQPSAIATINGEEAVKYLTGFAARNSVGKLEPHADWNMLMRSGALDAQGYLEVFYGGVSFYPGDTITITFENGTVRDPVPWQAMYLSPGYTGPVQTGGDIYNFFVLGLYPASYEEALQQLSSQQPPETTSTAAPDPPTWDRAYPSEADVSQQGTSISDNGLLRGYFLTAPSLAVLSIPHFASYGEVDAAAFVQTVKEFLKRSKEAGLKRIVIDVQQNMGGQPLLAIEIFKLFFPSIPPFAGSRRRVHPMGAALGAALTPYWETLTPNQSLYYHLLTNEWVLTSRLDADTGREFTSWEEYFRPAASYHGDDYSKTELYNLTSTVFTEEAASITIEDIDEPQPYPAEDIIILSDGLCSSACALFMELMHHEAKVRTVVAGGRPNYTPMQAPSGTRGAALYGTDKMDRDIHRARQVDNSTRRVLPTRGIDFFMSSASVNLRDQIRRNSSDIPLQFLYEAADCRIFFTPKTWYNYTNLWTYAAEAAWHNPALCVATSNSTASSSSDSNATAPFQVDVNDNDPIPSPHDYHAIDDPSNDIHDKGIPAGSLRGTKCESGNFCPGPLVCAKIEVCQKGEVVKKERCVPSCSKSYNYQTCGSDSFCFTEEHGATFTVKDRPDVRRKNWISLGYCLPISPPRCTCNEDYDPDEDTCFDELDPNRYALDCFGYDLYLYRCHVYDLSRGRWVDEPELQVPRYCSRTYLKRWWEQDKVSSSCYENTKWASRVCGVGTDWPIVYLHHNEEEHYFRNPETGEPWYR
ncbi:uncharacterized protein NFIA_099260 [Aspergillus fischeri NRRL 181]|uniref:CPAF-like PDZ domain-containing protein n=1 Tax=Neosartorya fischeri (strain ATCC 1020 / DSM 3700 / CBS 544.65 / FGSC A1164 / JCM 1740 / NRRL 181 / WB 181) TaxID=331117 RepID=A1DBQ2_NEOFI|nr:conserved hypothetical protein [Aspergillus fischeri NRRL 181]EAW20292.1 conserved hypothetical protein [Aspergillus fischeri NRRL 181]